MKIHKLWKRYSNCLKPFLITFIILGSLELIFGILESTNNVGEPYEWGNRNDIPFKINEAKDLFSTANAGVVKILILGDSRAEYDVDPRVVDNYFNETTLTYNIALSGTSSKFQIFLLKKAILPKIRPDFIIWVVSHNDLDDNIGTDQQNEDLLRKPMARFYSGDFEDLDFVGYWNNFLLTTSRIYRDGSYYFLRNFYTFQDWIRGYMQTYVQGYISPISIITDTPHSEPFDGATGQDFLNTLTLLKEKNIKSLIVSPPRNYYHYVAPELDTLYAKIAPESLLDLNGNLTLAPDIYYYNEGHLNTIGATLCSQIISEKISTQIDAIKLR